MMHYVVLLVLSFFVVREQFVFMYDIIWMNSCSVFELTQTVELLLIAAMLHVYLRGFSGAW
jgi:hypothetical protein